MILLKNFTLNTTYFVIPDLSLALSSRTLFRDQLILQKPTPQQVRGYMLTTNRQPLFTSHCGESRHQPLNGYLVFPVVLGDVQQFVAFGDKVVDLGECYTLARRKP